VTSPARFVVDASVGVKWLIRESGSLQARALLDRAVAGSARLVAPDVFAPEVTNALWKRARLLNDMSDEEARTLLRQLRLTLPRLVRSEPLLSRALELALAFRVPVYDCLYAALALRDGSTLVSADQRLIDRLGPATGRVVHIEALGLGR
jgi:predicted nucleic acid-binding protein